MQNTTDRTSGRHRGCQPHPRIVPIGAQVGWPSARLLATLTNVPFDDPDGVFESKWDGFRMVASIEHGRVTLYSRNGKIISDRYLPVARALEKVKRDAVIDGELVALDAHGISRFQLLQNALRAEANCSTASSTSCSATATDLRGLLLLERKDRLRRILPKHPLLALSEHRPEVPCIQARSDRADEECCARICLQGYPHQRSVPRTIDTPMVADMLAKEPEAMNDILRDQSIGRLGRAEEIASAVLWLCSPGASFVIGHALTVDGGYTAR